jgi:sortase A
MPSLDVRMMLRWLGTLMVVVGALVLAWCMLVWRWQDPFTAVYTYWQQRQLTTEYEHRLADFHPPPALTQKRTTPQEFELEIAKEARLYRRSLHEGDAIGRIEIPRLGLDMVMVNGTQTNTLKKGPARHLGTFLPGEGKLIYLAGHRTTYSAPFSAIDNLRRGDPVTIEVPYGTFEYRVTGHRIVAADDLAVLRSHGHEELALQACHPRFFASERYIAYARPVRVLPRDGPAYAYSGTLLTALSAKALPQ